MWCSIEVSGWEWFSSLESVVVSWILIKKFISSERYSCTRSDYVGRREEVGPGTSMHMTRYCVFIVLHIHKLTNC